MSTELTIGTLADRKDLPDLFLGTGSTSIEQIVEKIEAEARALVIDVTTKAGQDQCRSLAHKIAKAKSALDAAGKSKKEEYTVTTKRIDEDRRLAKDRLSALQDEIRAPLTAIEEAEKARIAAHEANLAALEAKRDVEGLNAEQVQARIDMIESKLISDSWDEFKTRALETKESVLADLKAKLPVLVKQEAEAAELERLRLAEAERKQKEREAELVREAEERANRAAQEREAASKAEAERKAKADQERIKRLEAEKQTAELREKQAAQAERDRIEAERQAALAAEEKRKADEAHVQSIELDIFNFMLTKVGLNNHQADAVLTQLMAGHVPHTKVTV